LNTLPQAFTIYFSASSRESIAVIRGVACKAFDLLRAAFAKRRAASGSSGARSARARNAWFMRESKDSPRWAAASGSSSAFPCLVTTEHDQYCPAAAKKRWKLRAKRQCVQRPFVETVTNGGVAGKTDVLRKVVAPRCKRKAVVDAFANRCNLG
jgi:hypothetical protein